MRAGRNEKVGGAERWRHCRAVACCVLGSLGAFSPWRMITAGAPSIVYLCDTGPPDAAP